MPIPVVGVYHCLEGGGGRAGEVLPRHGGAQATQQLAPGAEGQEAAAAAPVPRRDPRHRRLAGIPRAPRLRRLLCPGRARRPPARLLLVWPSSGELELGVREFKNWGDSALVHAQLDSVAPDTLGTCDAAVFLAPGRAQVDKLRAAVNALDPKPAVPEFKVVSRLKRRPTIGEVENMLYNLMAANSPVTQSARFQGACVQRDREEGETAVPCFRSELVLLR